jgi:dipeptidyl aminopeptidase/acylaminoacyl peptidase
MMKRLVTAVGLATLAGCGGGGGGGGASDGERIGDTHVSDTGEVPVAKKKPAPYDAVALIPAEALFGNPSKIAPTLSPDGKRLAYVAPHEGVLNVWVKTVGAEDDKVITADKLRGIRQYFWAENGKHIIYVQDQGGDENWHVYAVPAAGGEAVDLTPIKGVQAEVVGVERKHPDHILVGLNDRDPQFHDVYKIDVRSGKRTLVYKNQIGAVSFSADHDLRVRIAQVLKPDGGSALMHRASDKAKWKQIVAWGAEDMFTSGSTVGFSADNKTLYLLDSAGTNTMELRGLDTRTGKQKTIASDPGADVSEVMLDNKTYQVTAVGFNRARLEWKPLDKKVESDLAALRAVADAEIRVVSTDRADATWIVLLEDDDRPIRYYTYDRKTSKPELLFVAKPELDEAPLAEMKPVSYQTRDGLTIHGYLTVPRGVPAKKLPVVINPHGGPWARDTWGFDPLSQMLANRGYAVLQPNFRGSTGYGKKFLNAADREWGRKMQQDVTDGTKWLIAEGIADPDRICIMGGSYGGYATLMGLVTEPDLYACGVSIVPVANLITWLKTIPPYWVPFKHALAQRVGDPDKEVEFLKSRSPVFLADKIKKPLLLSAGKNDPRAPVAEATQIRDAVQKSGGQVEYIEFADEGHGFARPENRLAFFAAAEKFLSVHIGGRVENR